MKNTFNKNKKARLLLFVPLMIGLIFAIGGVVMVLWNAILPDLLGVKLIGYWQAMGLLVLCKILFGGFGSGGSGKNRFGKRRAFMRRKLATMNPEEREKFREEWRNRHRC